MCAFWAPSCVSVFVRVWGAILVVLGVSRAAFGGSWGVLGSIFEALGVPCAPFLELWGPNGWLWVSSEAPLAAQGAQSEIFPIFSFPFGGHFGTVFGAKSASESDAFFCGFWSGAFRVFGLSLGPVLATF